MDKMIRTGKNYSIITSKTYIFDEKLNLITDNIYNMPLTWKNIIRMLITETHDPIIIEGKTFCAVNDNNYYHWLLETIPRYKLLGKEKVDHYIIGNTRLFQKDIIKALKIPKRKVIYVNDRNFYNTDYLIYTKTISPTGNPTKASINYVRKLFLKEKKMKGYDKIFVSRKGAEHKRMEEIKTPKGYKEIQPEKYNVFKQAQIFNNAKVILGQHGAGLANIIFCKPGTLIIEIQQKGHENWCYKRIARIMKLKYRSIKI